MRGALFVGATGVVMAFSTPAFAWSSPVPPKITPTQATFTIPSGSAPTSQWTLKLWSHGTVAGSATATSGTLTVPVPATSDCKFQADVSVVPAHGLPYFYSGARATMPGCGPASTIGGDIFLCSAAGAPTMTEVPGGNLAATGPKVLAPQANPLAPTKVPAGTYTMTATSPSGYVFATCGGSASVGSNGTTASEHVVVPAGGAGVGTFYTVAAPSGSHSGGSGPQGAGSNKGPATSPGTPHPLTVRSQRVVITRANGSHLAFTGLNTGPLLLVGLSALALGVLASAVSRVRRRAIVAASTKSRSDT